MFCYGEANLSVFADAEEFDEDEGVGVQCRALVPLTGGLLILLTPLPLATPRGVKGRTHGQTSRNISSYSRLANGAADSFVFFLK